MPASRAKHLTLSLYLPSDRVDDAEYRELVVLLGGSSVELRDGREGPRQEMLVASWPDDEAHRNLTGLATRLVARYSGRLGGVAP